MQDPLSDSKARGGGGESRLSQTTPLPTYTVGGLLELTFEASVTASKHKIAEM